LWRKRDGATQKDLGVQELVAALTSHAAEE
jgi:hypothetical protein